MPRLSEFYGIVIRMHADDHQPPHLHARYGTFHAEIDLHTLTVQRGTLPARALTLVLDWALQHPAELDTQWERARQQLPLQELAPLS